MRPIILTSLILALTGSAHAQQPVQPVQRVIPGALAGSGAPAPKAARDGAAGRDALLQSAPAAGPQRAPRSDKAIGPDLMSYVFAPIGVIVTPIARDLHGIDEALAPLNELLLPITGPIDPALFAPADAVSPPAIAEPAQPAKVGPRK